MLAGAVVGVGGAGMLTAEGYTSATITREAQINVVSDDNPDAAVGLRLREEVIRGIDSQPLLRVTNNLGARATLSVEPTPNAPGTIHDESEAGDHTILDGETRLIMCSIDPTNQLAFEFTVELATDTGVTATVERDVSIVSPPVIFNWSVTNLGRGEVGFAWDATQIDDAQGVTFTVTNQDDDSAGSESLALEGQFTADLIRGGSPFRNNDQITVTAEVTRQNAPTYTETKSFTLRNQQQSLPEFESITPKDTSSGDDAILEFEYNVLNADEFGYIEFEYDRWFSSDEGTQRHSDPTGPYELVIPGWYNRGFYLTIRVCSPGGYVYDERNFIVVANGQRSRWVI